MNADFESFYLAITIHPHFGIVQKKHDIRWKQGYSVVCTLTHKSKAESVQACCSSQKSSANSWQTAFNRVVLKELLKC